MIAGLMVAGGGRRQGKGWTLGLEEPRQGCPHTALEVEGGCQPDHVPVWMARPAAILLVSHGKAAEGRERQD